MVVFTVGVLVHSYPGLSGEERASISGILGTASAHSETLEELKKNHCTQSTSIEQKALETFQQKFMVRKSRILDKFNFSGFHFVTAYFAVGRR